MLKMAGATVAGASFLGVESIAGKPLSDPDSAKKGKKKKVLVIGAHPDDPESCCGGTICRMKAEGFDVVVVYLTKGERGIADVSLEESARIRTSESIAACKAMGVRYIFMNQIDGASEINESRYIEMQELISREHPDAVLVHWPIDSHRDHVNCSVLVVDTWRRIGKFYDIFYHEAMTGLQSKTFAPTDWVDISEYHDLKVKALQCHKSQDVDSWYPEYHLVMEKFRGLEIGVKYAEAYVRFNQNPTQKSIMEV